MIRLERIKSWYSKVGSLARGDVNWLIEQTEKVERYKRALKEISDFEGMTLYEAQSIAQEALKAECTHQHLKINRKMIVCKDCEKIVESRVDNKEHKISPHLFDED
jgi:hypothetical protein